MTSGRVGVVFVSHSSEIADGLVRLAGQMAPEVRLIGVGGTDDGGLGTSFDRVSAALAAADDGHGVIVLCDLGSAVLTAELARDLLDDEAQQRVWVVDAPLVEGGVAAAVMADIGGDLTVVAAAAAAAGRTPAEPAPTTEPAEPAVSAASADPDPDPDSVPVTRTVTLVNRDGLHARPAADFVRLASTFDAQVSVNGQDATSLLGIMGLGLTTGRTIVIVASGVQAELAAMALADLVESGFGEV
ncbi:MAG: dihydroxyacetone kinase phosphoryl donor subunit DhaM [Cryobacterium sp.]